MKISIVFDLEVDDDTQVGAWIAAILPARDEFTRAMQGLGAARMRCVHAVAPRPTLAAAIERAITSEGVQ